MNTNNKFKNKSMRIFYFLILIGFLFPRGFSEVSTLYHKFSSLLVWNSVLLIWIQQILKLKRNTVKIKYSELIIFFYFVLAIIITYVNRKNISSGLQQLFAVPSLCLFLISNMKKECKKILDIILDILMLTFTLNIVCTKVFFSDYYHITFLGHVQVISQLGIVAVFSSVLYELLFKEKKKRNVYVVIIAIITMLTADADAATFCLIILISVFIIYKWKLYSLLCFNTKWCVIGMFLLNTCIACFSAMNEITFLTNLFASRIFVWKDAMVKIMEHPLIGYGVDGILLTPFWTQWTGGGFNYAHNQILQNLLDGGIFLLVAFWLMISSFVSNMKYIKDKKYLIVVNATMLALLIIMIPESTTLYSYMYIPLAIIYVLPDVVLE